MKSLVTVAGFADFHEEQPAIAAESKARDSRAFLCLMRQAWRVSAIQPKTAVHYRNDAKAAKKSNRYKDKLAGSGLKI